MIAKLLTEGVCLLHFSPVGTHSTLHSSPIIHFILTTILSDKLHLGLPVTRWEWENPQLQAPPDTSQLASGGESCPQKRDSPVQHPKHNDVMWK